MLATTIAILATIATLQILGLATVAAIDIAHIIRRHITTTEPTPEEAIAPATKPTIPHGWDAIAPHDEPQTETKPMTPEALKSLQIARRARELELKNTKRELLAIAKRAKLTGLSKYNKHRLCEILVEANAV